MKNTKRMLAVLLALCLCIGLIAGCTPSTGDATPTPDPNATQDPNATPAPTEEVVDIPLSTEANQYTYNSYAGTLATKWNPNTWEQNDESAVLGYLSCPFVDQSILDSENGIYQWVYDMATYITDVTAEHRDDITKYGANLGGKDLNSVNEGYVFEIGLNPDAKWQNGDIINADSYIYSMKELLNPKMRNYRSNLYWSGESAIVGGYAYYNSGAPIYNPMVPPYSGDEEPDYSYDLDAGIAAGEVYVNVTSDQMTLCPYTMTDLNSQYLGKAYSEQIDALKKAANVYGYTKVTAENLEMIKTFWKGALPLFGVTDEAEQMALVPEGLFVFKGEYGEEVDFDATVGLYKVDDYTIRYVTENAQELDYFLTSCTSTWLVHEATWEATKDYSGELVTSKYNTSVDTTMSYGPYMLESIQTDKQMVFVQNPNWYGWEKDENGNLVSYTNFEVDGQKQRQYQTTRIVINVLNPDAAKQAFLKGQLDEWTPSGEDLITYGSSDQMYKVDQTYTMRFFFDDNLDDLKEMDASKGNTNSVVLSNVNFRKAMSLAFDRAEYVTATAGHKPAYSLLSTLYFYNIYEDPESRYRDTDAAMQAICNIYGVEYGAGTPYATLRDAYLSINGYNLTEAKNLFTQACNELVEAGLYKAGDPVNIKVAWSQNPLNSSHQNQGAILNKQLAAAVEGTGFGTVTLELVGDVKTPYDQVPAGEYAMGYGAWGGAAFYPFRTFRVYCDPSYADLNEAASWDPTTETLTLKVNGEDVTMTWQEWSVSMTGNGAYAAADFETKLQLTADLEENLLKTYHMFPMCTTTSCSMLGYKLAYYTEDYNIMYDFGGLRLLKYNYDDAGWAEAVEAQGNQLSYE